MRRQRSEEQLNDMSNGIINNCFVRQVSGVLPGLIEVATDQVIKDVKLEIKNIDGVLD